MVRCLLVALPLLIALAPAVAAPEPAVQRTTVEDDNVRIDELRVRGVTQPAPMAAR